MSFQAPTLETERLKLRSHRLEDFSDFAAMWTDPIVVKHIGGKPSTEQQSWARLLNYVGHWSLMGFGYWAIEEKSSGKFIGELGFADFKREMSPSIAGIPELGWALTSFSHGKGYATEALQKVIEWGETNLKTDRIVCIIDPGNKRSLRLAEKFGFEVLHHTLYKGEPTTLFGRPRSLLK
jgi:RimJ/RimL family protein N-acetyltransferase